MKKLKVGKTTSVYFAYSHPSIRSNEFVTIPVSRRVSNDVSAQYKMVTTQGRTTISLPKCAISYNYNMCGSDVLDRKISQYKTVVPTHRWWTRCFFWYLDLIIINCHILYRHYHPKMLLEEFRLSIIKELIGTSKYTRNKRRKLNENENLLKILIGFSRRYFHTFQLKQKSWTVYIVD